MKYSVKSFTRNTIYLTQQNIVYNIYNCNFQMAEQNISMNFQYGTESLNYYFRQGKVSQEEFSIIQEAMKNLYNVINSSVKNYNSLHNASKQLKKEVNAAKFEYDAAGNRQFDASNATERLSRLLKTAEVAY